MKDKPSRSKAYYKRLLSKCYRFVKRQYHTKLGTDKDLILVYTLSKVGSSSVYHSLKKKFPYKEIHHVHFLGETWLTKFKNEHQVFQNNLKNADRIFHLLKRKRWNLKIISLTRDPIARDISGIFQTWQHIFNVSDITEVTAEDILDYLSKNDFSYSENWFETDFTEFTGLDIFKEKFDSNKGYQVYSTKKAPILVMQLEQLNKVYNEAMKTFLGKGIYTLQDENITASRSSGELNNEIKKIFKLPLKKVREIYSSRYMSTFYNDSQIQKLKDRWLES